MYNGTAKIAFSIFHTAKTKGTPAEYYLEERGVYICQGVRDWFLYYDEFLMLMRSLHKIEETTTL